MPDINTMQYPRVTARREHGNPRPRLTADGYTKLEGSPTRLQVQLETDTKWRRVYVLCFSNAATPFVRVNGKPTFIHL